MLVINSTIELDKFDLLPWEGQNRYYFTPAIWDALLAPSGYFKSGIGYSFDCVAQGVTNNWTARVKTGHYYFRDQRYYLYSNDSNHGVADVVSFDPGNVVSGYYQHSLNVQKATQAYYGFNPVFLGNFRRIKDKLFPNVVYEQKRVFSNILSNFPSGYVPVASALPYSPDSSKYEFMVERAIPEYLGTTITGEVDGIYYEGTQYGSMVQPVLLNNYLPLTEEVVETFDIKGQTVYCKLGVIPAANINSVVIQCGGASYESPRALAVSGYVPGSYMLLNDPPGTIVVMNSTSGMASKPDDYIYPSGIVSVTYTPGLLYSHDNSAAEETVNTANLNPLIAGSDNFNLLLTNTEVDPVSISMLTGRNKCYVAGLPLELRAKVRFNEAPILSYPVLLTAGLSRLTTNNLTLNTYLKLRCDEEGVCRGIYVPPKSIDDETFKFRLGQHVPIIDLGEYTPGPSGTVAPSNILHGTAFIGAEGADYRNTLVFPATKYAKLIMSSIPYAIYDLDPIRNNDWIGFLGMLQIIGEKQTLVLPCRALDKDWRPVTRKPRALVFPEEKYQVEYNYKFRTDEIEGLILKFKPYSTLSNKLMVYVNDRLVGVFNGTVPSNTSHTSLVQYNLNYEYFLYEKYNFNSYDKVYFNRKVVNGLPQGELKVYPSIDGLPYEYGTDYTLTAGNLVRVPSGSIPSGGTVYVSYLAESSYINNDSVNRVRFITTDYTFTIDNWDVTDVSVNKVSSMTLFDNSYCNALPIALFTLTDGMFINVPLDKVSSDTQIQAAMYYNLPHSVNTDVRILGYYLFTKGQDFIQASVKTSYGKEIGSGIYNIKIEAPDYMKGFYFKPSYSFTTASPYSSINFRQDSSNLHRP